MSSVLYAGWTGIVDMRSVGGVLISLCAEKKKQKGKEMATGFEGQSLVAMVKASDSLFLYTAAYHQITIYAYIAWGFNR